MFGGGGNTGTHLTPTNGLGCTSRPLFIQQQETSDKEHGVRSSSRSKEIQQLSDWRTRQIL